MADARQRRASPLTEAVEAALRWYDGDETEFAWVGHREIFENFRAVLRRERLLSEPIDDGVTVVGPPS